MTFVMRDSRRPTSGCRRQSSAFANPVGGSHGGGRAMSRILYIGHVWPEPRSSAAGSRALALLRTFSQAGWHITVASAAERGPRSEGLEGPDGLADETAAIVLNDSGFDRFVASAAPDVVVFDRFMIEEQFGWRVEQQCPGALRVLDTVDLHCVRRVRQALCGADDRGGAAGSSADKRDQRNQALEAALLRSDDAKREIASILRSDLTLVISGYEIDLLTHCFGLAPELLHYLPFMISSERRGGLTESANARLMALPPFEQRRHFATIGNFMHPPNLDAFAWMRDAIWPLIRRALPQAELHVYGAYSPQAVEACDDPAAGLRIKGWAPDAHAALAAARVCLAPLRFGAGLKGKIADAMVAGTPTVTTTVGAEGMGDGSPHDGSTASANGAAGASWCGAIADDPQSIAAAAVALHEDPQAWHRAQTSGFEIIDQCFDAATHGRVLLDRIAVARDERDTLRNRNFTGAMLRHHHHRATEFMARWIEAKNR